MEQVVYVVDDDQGMLDSTVWLLESVGLKALPFISGRAFLDACDPNLNACVLLDVRMPGMGGLNVQEAMRARGIDLPVIFVSGHADVPIVVRAFKAGACDFIEKPYNEQMLLDSVQQALGRHGERRSGSRGQEAVQARLDALTPRERDVLLPLVQGYTNREIAEQLEISVKTVDLYRMRVMKRMQAERHADLVGMAIAAGLVDPLNLRASATVSCQPGRARLSLDEAGH
ncbi:response regulator transcription factor [Azotobacter vinelandii]|nr:response regulator transcription factor [Azotobacter vinelandii]WKN24369.1 response regulator transcription factor [Azotobacter vinelandii]GLK61122.1 DNA-binding response regulator [Azotobacter vinelandii]SFY06121.1 two component transcriptional regulator, LuxR family [Azotobacter vinelandii]